MNCGSALLCTNSAWIVSALLSVPLSTESFCWSSWNLILHVHVLQYMHISKDLAGLYSNCVNYIMALFRSISINVPCTCVGVLFYLCLFVIICSTQYNVTSMDDPEPDDVQPE